MGRTGNRLDTEMVARGIADTRHKAQALILAGQVLVDGHRADKAGTNVPGDSVISLKGEPMPYVSRGGLKLKGAVDQFGIDVAGKTCADFGASTGGFTDCMLQEGAAKVYAVDVGYGQLDAKVANDPRVVVMDRVNVRLMEPDALGVKVDLASVDLSFISLKLVLKPIASMVKPGGSILALVKPQFEVGRQGVGKGGIVRDDAERERALAGVASFAEEAGLAVVGSMVSPITGAKGNVEYILYMTTPV